MRATLFAFAFCLASIAQAQWQILDTHSTADFRGVSAPNPGIIWISGTKGTILRSEDAGYLWQHCTTPPNAEHLDFRGIQAFDANTAIVMSSGKGDLSRLYKTTDGCQTWKLVLTNPDTSGFFDAVRFISISDKWGDHQLQVDHARGSVLGDPVNGEFVFYSTNDGGNTWERRVAQKRDHSHGCTIRKFPALPGESAFAASNEALVVDDIPPYFITGGSRSRLAYVQHFDLDGALCSDTSKFLTLPFGGTPSSGAFASAPKTLKGLGDGSMMIVGGDYLHPESSANTAVFVWMMHNNLGDTMAFPWLNVRKPQTPPHGYRSAVAYDEPTKTWITVGPNGTDISTDDGHNWRGLHPGKNDAPDADKNWNALAFPYVVGPHGRIGVLDPLALK